MNESNRQVNSFQPLVNDTVTLEYPETKKDEVIDLYFGHEIVDPYRWLEDDRSEETALWVAAQNEVTFSYLDKIPFRSRVRHRLEELYNYEKLSSPFHEGQYTYFYKNDGLQNQSILYRRKDGSDKEEVFLDPNQFSEDGTTSLAGVSFTEDGSKVAYLISEGGSDWRKVVVMDTETMEVIEDTLENVKFSSISWLGTEGFYYSSYEKPEGSELSAKTDEHIVYYHQLGTAQDEDKAIFGDSPSEKHRYVGAYVTEDQRYLVITAAVSTSGNRMYIQDLTQDGSDFIIAMPSIEHDCYLLDNKGSTLYIMTNYDAPNGRVVRVDADQPGYENWVDVIPETEFVLNPTRGGGYIFAKYMEHAISRVVQYDYEGNQVREIQLPGEGTVYGFDGKKEDKNIFFSFTNYATPTTIFKLDPSEGTYEEYWSPEVDFDPAQYVSKQFFYTSKDGTNIPITITHRNDLPLDGNNPTILYGYGGFNISIQPRFNPLLSAWLEQGGIYAVPNLRGGGEYGKKWHDAGTQMQKQNVFDDFITAAEYLIEQGYTSSQKLAISGRSNGGLLVGAVMTQRPDLIQVALPGVGVLDMLRYHTFTAGAGWAYDYGRADQSEEMFMYLKGYSPVHNVRPVEYPATLVYTADHDDRVVPAHSFKFISELQSNQQGLDPVLIRVETKSGHGAGKPTDKILDEWADIYSFTMYNMHVQPSY